MLIEFLTFIAIMFLLIFMTGQKARRERLSRKQEILDNEQEEKESPPPITPLMKEPIFIESQPVRITTQIPVKKIIPKKTILPAEDQSYFTQEQDHQSHIWSELKKISPLRKLVIYQEVLSAPKAFRASSSHEFPASE